MTCERCLVDQKLFIEKNDFKVFKDFDTEYKLEHENAARVMQLNIQIPQTILFLMVHDIHHVNIIENILYTNKIYIYI